MTITFSGPYALLITLPHVKADHDYEPTEHGSLTEIYLTKILTKLFLRTLIYHCADM